MPATADLTVRDVMDPAPVAVGPDATVQHVLSVMNARRIGSVLVVRDGTTLAGIFTERDLIKRVAAAVPGWRDYPVSDWMTADPHTIRPEVGYAEAVARMQNLRVRHMPVLDAAGGVVGLVSTRLLADKRDAYLNQRIAERTAELRAVNGQLLARDAEVAFNMRAAGQLQTRALLPQAPPPWPELRWAVHYAPLDHLGGDYYDFATPDPDHLGFLIADASGHSIPAAMVAVMARFAFADAAARSLSPGEVLGVMNRQLHALTDERFVTAFYGVADRRTGVVRYAAAGHPHPIHYSAATGEVAPLLARGFVLGVVPEEVYAERAVTLSAGDKIIFYTDGVTDARNEIGEMFGSPRIVRALVAHAAAPAADLLAGVLADLRDFCGGTPYNDDVTLAVAEVVPWEGPE